MIWMFLALSRAKGGCCLLQQDVDLGLVLEWLMSIFSTDCTIFGWDVPTVILFYILCNSKTCGTVAGTLISRYNGRLDVKNDEENQETWNCNASRIVSIMTYWRLVKDFHCVCKRNAKLESLSKNGGEVICELWILITFYTGLHTKFWNQDLPILHWAFKWALLYWDALFVRDNVPCFSFFLLFQGTLPLILLYLYMLARQE